MTLQDIITQTRADGSDVAASFSCQLVQVRENATKTGKPYLDVEISDGTAAEKFKIWQDSPAYEAVSELQPGACVRLNGTFWRNQFGMNVEDLRVRQLEKNEIVELFAGTSERQALLAREEEEINGAVAAMKDPRLRLLCQSFLAEYAEKFRRAAAARDYHHARRGGLLEHTAQMTRSGVALSKVYTSLNWDLILAGILLHDCGKLWENDYLPDGFVSPITTRGELLGHIPIGIEVVNRIWRGLEAEGKLGEAGQPPREIVREHLLHMIASHHGQREFGAPVTPRTPEAWMLHYIDNIDAKHEMLKTTYAEKQQVAPGIFDYRRPLEGHAIEPLSAWQPS